MDPQRELHAARTPVPGTGRLPTLPRYARAGKPALPTIATLSFQESRMLQIQGVEGEAVVCCREPSTTKKMQYPRLSRRVNDMAVFHDLRMSPKVNSINNVHDVKPTPRFCSPTSFPMLFMQP